MKTIIRALAALIGICAFGAVAQFPSKPVRVIVPVVPGPADTFARVISDKLSEQLKQTFVVENRPGAGGNVGAEVVAKAPADGHTVLFAIDTTFTVNPSLYARLPFDPDKDFTAVSLPVNTGGQMLAVNALVPAKSLQELVALSKQKRMTYATGGNGSASHLTAAYFLSTAGTEMTHVPYKGTGQSIVDVVAGQVDTIFAVLNGVYPHVKGGKLRALAVSSLERSVLAPEVPTIAELGYPGFEVTFAYAIMVASGTNNDVVQLLNREIVRTTTHPDVQTRMRAADYVATPMDPRASAAWLKVTREKWAKVIASAGIRIE